MKRTAGKVQLITAIPYTCSLYKYNCIMGLHNGLGMSSHSFYVAVLIGCSILNIVKSLSISFTYFKLCDVFKI